MAPSLREIALRNGSHSRMQSLQLPRRYWHLKREYTKTGLMKTVSQYKHLWTLLQSSRMTPTSVAKKTQLKKLQTRVQSKLLKMHDQWWQDKVKEVQSYADSHNAKMFFPSLKTLYGLSRSGCSPLLPSDGTTLIKGQVGIRERWAEHFSSLLNRPTKPPSSQSVRSST